MDRKKIMLIQTIKYIEENICTPLMDLGLRDKGSVKSNNEWDYI